MDDEVDMKPSLLRRQALRLAASLAVCMLGVLGLAGPARAVPAFAVQAGQPCQVCHVGGFGPQLTAYGRKFKLEGYTERMTRFNVPLAAMAVASYVQTRKAQDEPPAEHFHTNHNTALDEASLFFAGGFGDHVGAFAQVTYDGVERAWSWDQLDLRLVTKTQLKDRDLVLGVSVNNNPGVQDPWNTLPAWGFPYTDSALAPSPATAPLLSGALAQASLGATAYAWLDSRFYAEAGAYRSPGAKTLRRLGADPTDPGDIKGAAPYGRLAWQQQIGQTVWEVGAFGFQAEIHPGRDRDTGLIDRYTDLGVDASVQAPLAHGDLVAVDARYVHERQRLAASCSLALGAPAGDDVSQCARNSLEDLRLTAAYYWRKRYGLSVGAFDTWGTANEVLYADNRRFRPDSSGVTVQVDATPFGGAAQPARRINVRVGVQYTKYFRFNGARRDFDGTGRDASDNDTLRVFTWFAF